MLARVVGLVARRAESAQLAQQLVRTYAGSASATKIEAKLPTAPLQMSGTSGAIATLAWQVAAKENQLAKVQDELYQLVEVFKNHTEIRRLATDPFLPAAFRMKVVKDLTGSKETTEITKRLMEALADENALSGIVEVTNAFEDLMLAHKKEVHCTVVTAQPLDDAERAVFTKQATAFVEKGFKLVMKEKVDRKLLGGFVLEFEDRLVDMSKAKKLEEFNNLVTKLENDLK